MANKKKEDKTLKKRGRPKKVKEEPIKEEIKQPMSKAGKIALLILFVSLFVFALTRVGRFGVIVSNIFTFLFGGFYFSIGLTLIFFLVKELFTDSKEKLPVNVMVGILILNIAVLMFGGLIEYNNIDDVSFNIFGDIFKELPNIASASCDFGGGIVGTLTYVGARVLFDKGGAIAVLVILFVIAGILIIPLTYFLSAFDASKRAVEHTATSFEDARIQRELKKKAEMERLQAIEEAKAISAINEPEPIKQEEENLEQNDIQEENNEEIEINSVFAKNYFIDANIEKNQNEDNYEDDSYASKVISVVDELNEPKQEVQKSHNEKNIQTKLEDAVEPKLPTESKTLKRANPFVGYKLPDEKSGLLLKANSANSDKNESSAQLRGKKLIEILCNFGFTSKLVDTHIGPSVTKFEIIPDARINVNKIHAIIDNIKMGLAAKSVRIEAPIPGKTTIGVEVPNAENVAVRMSELISNVPQNKKRSPLLFALGKDLSGTPVFCELNKMPHLLIAGATGSGKSVCINTIITSYLLRCKPDIVKLVLVDPKKVEFTPYHDIPHLLWPVITDAKMASLMLKKIVIMMEERYDVFSKAAVRDINSYNEKVIEHNKNLKQGENPMERLPFIVVIIDELADLMTVANKEVEGSIQRITQLARASGIHLIVATQRPSTDVITGLIKSNIPSRISFAVSSSIDSRTILDTTGAEKLLGNGDMLYAPQGENAPIRLQGCYVTDEEIQKITKFCKDQAKPQYDDTYFALANNEKGSTSNATSGEEDDLYNDAVEFIAKTKKASTSSLQRRFGIGYNRAARLIDTLEENGLIGPANGSKPREVYVSSHDNEE